MSRRCPQCGTEYADQIAFCGNDGSITIQVQPAGETPDRRLGTRFGDYVAVARVADGAMGRVYEGRHAQTKQRVAVKVLHDDVAKDRVAVERFKREFETAKDLDSKHVVRVIDFGEAPEVPGAPGSSGGVRSWFMTMEYLQGIELGGVLRGAGALPLARALRVMCQVALGLEDAHSFGVIHRDLKPDNLFLCEGEGGDDVRILDFGSVKLQMETGPKLTAFGTTLGSPYYMSPEQAMGKQDVDQRTDVFALAAILYEMLTGKIAFDGQAVAQILMKIVNEMPAPASTQKAGLPGAIDDVIEKGLAKDKRARYGSTVELAAAALGAFGLPVQPGRAGIEQWAHAPIAQLEQALASATPPAPKPYGAPEPAVAPQAPAPTSIPMTPTPSHDALSTPAPPSNNLGLMIGLGVGAMVFLGLVGAVAMFFLMR
ncbi:serine/threonine-protein kinase [Sandaracinus amylolyticus]|uniref:Serine/threonine protein kinase n=1 Tax=Sandaracinus amylolyticus TaxID=927083 RepID=A0A0F6W5E9_9BACT|nr:serine/threonine-protein kinase [Sandaracinus amylolyticus]AKF07886.1 serine/threonine protein kinase [Sandaracinus amylolyticus]